MNWKQYRNTPYEVSDQGDVRRNGKVLAGGVNRYGYRQHILCLGGVRATALAHRMVAEVFVQRPDGKTQVNHLNGVKLDNSAINLEWCTQVENNRHARATGLVTAQSGEDASNAQLSVDQVEEIRRLYAEGSTQYELADRFDTRQSNIHRIVTGRTWRRAGGPITDGSRRRSHGSSHGRATLTEDQVREIRLLHGTISRTDLAERFGLSVSGLAKILYRKSWKHL